MYECFPRYRAQTFHIVDIGPGKCEIMVPKYLSYSITPIHCHVRYSKHTNQIKHCSPVQVESSSLEMSDMGE